MQLPLRLARCATPYGAARGACPWAAPAGRQGHTPGHRPGAQAAPGYAKAMPQLCYRAPVKARAGVQVRQVRFGRRVAPGCAPSAKPFSASFQDVAEHANSPPTYPICWTRPYYIYICIHTIHIYIHTYTHACMQTYIHTCMHTYTCIHTYIHTSHAYIQA